MPRRTHKTPKTDSSADVVEKLEAMGHETESEGIKWTKYFMDQFDKDQWDKDQIKLDKLDHARRFTKRNYFHLLASMLNEELKDMDIPDGYMFAAYSTAKGVVTELIDKSGQRYRRAFTPCGTPKIDHHCIVLNLIQAQDTVDLLEEEIYRKQHTVDGLKKTESGIIIPN